MPESSVPYHAYSLPLLFILSRPLTGYKHKSSINKIELGINDLPQSKIEEFAVALKTTPALLMGWDDENNKREHSLPGGYFISQSEQSHIEKYRALDERGKETVDGVLDMEYKRTSNITESKEPESKKVLRTPIAAYGGSEQKHFDIPVDRLPAIDEAVRKMKESKKKEGEKKRRK